jgi:uroporphyrinogen decarboxylase
MRQAGRYLPEYREVRSKVASFLELCRTPELAAEATLQPLRRFDLDAAIVFSDILMVPYALGQKVEFVEEGPRLEPLRNSTGIARLNLTNAAKALGPVSETVERVKAALPQGIPLIGFCGAPWTVATYMVEGQGSKDQAEARFWAYRDRVTFQCLIEVLVEASADYLVAQAKAGADVLQVFDSWAGSLSEDEFTRWCIAPTKRLVEQVKTKLGAEIPIIGFPRGAGVLAERYARETGINAIGCDASMPVGWMRRLQERLPVQGNLDPLLLVAGGQELDARVDAILETLGSKPFIFNLGHGIRPETPIEHVERLVSLVKSRPA